MAFFGGEPMKKNIKHIAVIAAFAVVIALFLTAGIIAPDGAVSKSERRRLDQSPEFSWKDMWSGELFSDLEDYFLDQFWQRDVMRRLKSAVARNIFVQKDVNGIFVLDGEIYKLDHPTDERNITRFAAKINEVCQKYLAGCDVAYAVIPDKNYFVPERAGYLRLDHQRLVEIMNGEVDARYLDLFGVLDAGDYYSTDLHWRQERITRTAEEILRFFGNGQGSAGFEEVVLGEFEGAYYGQAAMKLPKDKMVYLTNAVLGACLVKNGVTGEEVEMYDKNAFFNNIDPYDMFCGGPLPLVEILNPSGNGKEMVIFRDSFASSLAPLLASGYSKITLVDLRYIHTNLVGEYVDFSQNPDVLFLYGTLAVNSIVLN